MTVNNTEYHKQTNQSADFKVEYMLLKLIKKVHKKLHMFEVRNTIIDEEANKRTLIKPISYKLV